MNLALTLLGFCGFYVGGAGAELFNNATEVVLMRAGTRTVLSMQNNYQGPPKDFAMVVPVPVILQKEAVKTLPREVFKKVDQLGAPRLVEYWEQDPCPPPYDPRVVESAAADVVEERLASGVPRRRPKDLGVTVEAKFEVGEYQILILSAKEATGLEIWLREYKYSIPPNAAPLLKPYITGGWKFFVAKVDVSKVKFENGSAVLSPLRFHYDSEEFRLPVRLGLINAGAAQDLIVSILAPERYELANYANVTIPTNLTVAPEAKPRFGELYAALFDATVAKNPGAVVTEYAWASNTCDPCPGPTLDSNDLLTLGVDVSSSAEVSMKGQRPLPGGKKVVSAQLAQQLQSGLTLTRLHARYTRESLGEDLVFRAARPIVGGRDTPDPQGRMVQGSKSGPVNNFQGRYAVLHWWEGKVECKEPRRGLWGGYSAPQPAVDTAFVKRGDVQLEQLVTQNVPELELKTSAKRP
ncbi:MAG: DUF2330 domain-containing protein [Myxococcaceae bacterium]|nr:DUF2330 domain-containing protein [Myxococcaceae bacterium]